MPAGRPTKYSQRLGKQIADMLRSGVTRTAAACASGISFNTFLRWLKDEKNVNFVSLVEAAEAEWETRLTVVVSVAAYRDPYLALKVLERRRKGEWALTGSTNMSMAVEIEAALGGADAISVSLRAAMQEASDDDHDHEDDTETDAPGDTSTSDTHKDSCPGGAEPAAPGRPPGA